MHVQIKALVQIISSDIYNNFQIVTIFSSVLFSKTKSWDKNIISEFQSLRMIND